MTVQYLRALHSADFPRGREKGGCWPGKGIPGQGACATHKDLGVAIGVKGRKGEVSSLDTAEAGVGSGPANAKGEGAEEPVSAYTGSAASSQVGRGGVSLLLALFPVSRLEREEGPSSKNFGPKVIGGAWHLPWAPSREGAAQFLSFLWFFSPVQQNC